MAKKEKEVNLTDIKNALLNDAPQKETFITSSCSLLNLALSDKYNGGFEGGTVVVLTGEKHTGKSLIAGSVLAEVAHNKHFDNYNLFYHDVENGFKFCKESFFGVKGAKRIQDAPLPEESHAQAHTVYDFAYGFDKAVEQGKPFIYVVDSIDALGVPDEIAKAKETEENYMNGKSTAGDYGAAKAKYLGNLFKRIVKPLQGTDSVLILICQTRDKLSGMGGKTRSGGQAIGFYANTEIWLSQPMRGAKIEKTVNGKIDQIGSRTICAIKKNRISGKPRAVKMVLYNGYGIDDISTTIEWLKEYGYMKGTTKISIDGIDFEGSEKSFIKHIEENNLEDKLKEILQECWRDRESKLTPDRKPKFRE